MELRKLLEINAGKRLKY